MAPPKKKAQPQGTRKPGAETPPKGPAAAKPTPRQAVVAAPQTGGGEVVSEEYQKLMEQYAGEGISSNPSDFLIPMIYILQPLSPQVLRDNQAFIDGAEPGYIWLKSSLEDPLQGDIWFQPCHHYRKWVEWVPRKQGGGFVASYDPDRNRPTEPPPGLKAKIYRDPENPKATRWKMPNGNDLIDTQYYVGYVLEENGMKPREYIMPLASTQHQFGRALMTHAKNRIIEEGPFAGRPAALWSSMFHITTELRKNNSGEWYVFKFTDNDNVRWVSQDQFMAGVRLMKAFETGIAKPDYEGQQDGGGEGNSDTM
jgi:hypothetical protein